MAELRAAAKEGFDAIGRGDYTALRSGDEIDAFTAEILTEVSLVTPMSTKIRYPVR